MYLWNLGGTFVSFRIVFESSEQLGKGLEPYNFLLKGVNAIFENHKNCNDCQKNAFKGLETVCLLEAEAVALTHFSFSTF